MENSLILHQCAFSVLFFFFIRKLLLLHKYKYIIIVCFLFADLIKFETFIHYLKNMFSFDLNDI